MLKLPLDALLNLSLVSRGFSTSDAILSLGYGHVHYINSSKQGAQYIFPFISVLFSNIQLYLIVFNVQVLHFLGCVYSHFHFFAAIANGIVFLISISDTFLLDTTDLCKLILYSTPVLNSRISSSKVSYFK